MPTPRHPWQQPVGNLPVATNPAMLAADVGGITRRIFFVQAHITQEAGAHITTFEQVVAQNAVFRKPVPERVFKSINIVNTLADERPFAEKILIDVGHEASVWINTGFAATEFC